MAVITCHLNETSLLGMATQVSIIIPEPAKGPLSLNVDSASLVPPDRKFPVLWLLHGGGDIHSDWLYRSDIFDLANQYEIAVVMPDAQMSFFTDMAHGPQWFTYLTKALPAYVYEHFPLSDRREDNFVAGASMGGYGALLFALRCPNQYAAAALLGSGVSLPQQYAAGPMSLGPSGGDFDRILGDAFGEDRSAVLDGPNDCYGLTRKLKEAGETGVPFPKLLSLCGRRDFGYQQNIAYRDYVRSLGLACDWYETDADHSFKTWHDYLPVILEWLPIAKKPL
jgi:putative tributyrin esterase